MSTADLPAIRGHQAQPTSLATIERTMDALMAFRTFVKGELKPNLDFGTIPGTNKPTLLQPGAQKICLYHNAYPDHKVSAVELGNGHIEYLVTTVLISRATDKVIGNGIGSCSSMESRYRFRNANKTCPHCGQETIIKGKEEFGGGWLCYGKKGGCGAKFRDNDPSIANQKVGQVENENIHDVRNTVLKMAVKRSLVAAALALGCASEMFTQDLEDTYDLRIVPRHDSGEIIEPEVDPPARDERRSAVNRDFSPASERHPDNASGHGRGQYASPDQIKAYAKWRDRFVSQMNSAWVDKWTDKETGEVEIDIKDILTTWQLDGHLLKWAVGANHLDASIDPKQVKAAQRDSYIAVVFHRDAKTKAALKAEASAYAAKEATAARAKWFAEHPEAVRDDEPIPAEDVSQEGPETEEREPGSDDE